jgi:hypothetical protein
MRFMVGFLVLNWPRVAMMADGSWDQMKEFSECAPFKGWELRRRFGLVLVGWKVERC